MWKRIVELIVGTVALCAALVAVVHVIQEFEIFGILRCPSGWRFSKKPS
jgi:hypothetical protein